MSFNFKDIIRSKQNGNALTKEQIYIWIEGVTNKTIQDYHLSALLMAIFFNGMNIEERRHLTTAMAKSGKPMNYRNIEGKKIDKHSTGGIGDKTSLILLPLMMELGVKVPMISGRGLAHTGGTVDKLEAIPGYIVELPFEETNEMMEKIGRFLCG